MVGTPRRRLAPAYRAGTNIVIQCNPGRRRGTQPSMSKSFYPAIIAMLSVTAIPVACTVDSEGVHESQQTLSSPRLAELGIASVVLLPDGNSVFAELLDVSGESVGTLIYEREAEIVAVELLRGAHTYRYASTEDAIQFSVGDDLLFHKTPEGIQFATHDEHAERHARNLEIIVQVLALFDPVQGWETPADDDVGPDANPARDTLSSAETLGVMRAEHAGVGTDDRIHLFDASDALLAAVQFEIAEGSGRAWTTYEGHVYEYADHGRVWDFSVDGTLLASLDLDAIAAGERPEKVDPRYELGFSYIGAAMEAAAMGGGAPSSLGQGNAPAPTAFDPDSAFDVSARGKHQNASIGDHCKAVAGWTGKVKKGESKSGSASASYWDNRSKSSLCTEAETNLDKACKNMFCDDCVQYNSCSAWCWTGDYHCTSAEKTGFACDCERTSSSSSGSGDSCSGGSSAGGDYCAYDAALGCC